MAHRNYRLGQITEDAERHLRLAAIPNPFLDTTLILAHCLACSPERLPHMPQGILEPPIAKRFWRLIRRRAKGYPVAYICGQRAFYRHHFKVDRRVLIPRPESELLVEVAAQRIGQYQLQSLYECGVGSGAIIVSLAALFDHLSCSGGDSSRSALQIAGSNSDALLGPGRIKLIHGSLLGPLSALPALPDIVVANLPYLTKRESRATGLRYEPRRALYGGRQGLTAIAQLIHDASRQLMAESHLLLECAPQQREALNRLLQQSRFQSIQWHRDLAGDWRVVAAQTPSLRP